jgi:flagellin-like protein
MLETALTGLIGLVLLIAVAIVLIHLDLRSRLRRQR